jgi:hypothetical protein
MAGSLVKIDEVIVSSASASVTLTGIDSTYDVYVVKMNGVYFATNQDSITMRVTTSGTPQTGSNYAYAGRFLGSDVSGGASNYYSSSDVDLRIGIGADSSEKIGNGILYLFNFNNASEYSFVTNESSYFSSDADSSGVRGFQGGGVHKVAEANDGVNFFEEFTGANIEGGTFSLYGLKK